MSWPTAKRWADRYRQLGPAGMNDASSRPHRSPNRTPQPVVRKIVHLRWKQRLGPVQIADRVGLAPSTVHAVLVRCRLNRLTHLDRATGEPIRRYEHDHPGVADPRRRQEARQRPRRRRLALPGRARGDQQPARHPQPHRRRTPTAPPEDRHRVRAHRHRRPLPGRLRRDPRRRDRRHRRRSPATEPWPGSPPAASPSNGCCPTTASAYRSYLWRDTCAELGITPKKTRPYRPQTNGKIERFHRTLADGWAFKKFYNSESARRAALPAWLHHYNHHRPHTAIGGSAPISRLTNLPDQYT